MSFPVHDTMMIEPTESEAKRELDRFCDAMIAIRKEIEDIENGKADRENQFAAQRSPYPPPAGGFARRMDQTLHQRAGVLSPLGALREDKYWPPVGRIDNVHGDRNLVCACRP